MNKYPIVTRDSFGIAVQRVLSADEIRNEHGYVIGTASEGIVWMLDRVESVIKVSIGEEEK